MYKLLNVSSYEWIIAKYSIILKELMLLRPFPYIVSMASAKQRNWKAIEHVCWPFQVYFTWVVLVVLGEGRGVHTQHTHTSMHTHTHIHIHTHIHTHTHTHTAHTHTHTKHTHTHIYTEFMDKSNLKKPGLCQVGWYTAGLLTWICLFSKYNLCKS